MRARSRAKRYAFSGENAPFGAKTPAKAGKTGSLRPRFPSAKRAISRPYAGFSFRPPPHAAKFAMPAPSSSSSASEAAWLRLGPQPRERRTRSQLRLMIIAVISVIDKRFRYILIFQFSTDAVEPPGAVGAGEAAARLAED